MGNTDINDGIICAQDMQLNILVGTIQYCIVEENIIIIAFSGHQGANPWQSGMSPSGSGGGMGGEKRKAGLLPSPRASNSTIMQGGGRQGSYDIAGAINQLQEMDSPQSKTALNLLDSVLSASSKVLTNFVIVVKCTE